MINTKRGIAEGQNRPSINPAITGRSFLSRVLKRIWEEWVHIGQAVRTIKGRRDGVANRCFMFMKYLIELAATNPDSSASICTKPKMLDLFLDMSIEGHRRTHLLAHPGSFFILKEPEHLGYPVVIALIRSSYQQPPFCCHSRPVAIWSS